MFAFLKKMYTILTIMFLTTASLVTYVTFSGGEPVCVPVDDNDITINEDICSPDPESIQGMLAGSTGQMMLIPSAILFIICLVALLPFK